MTAATLNHHRTVRLAAGIWQGAKRAGLGRDTADLTRLGITHFFQGAVAPDPPNDTTNGTEPIGAIE